MLIVRIQDVDNGNLSFLKITESQAKLLQFLQDNYFLLENVSVEYISEDCTDLTK